MSLEHVQDARDVEVLPQKTDYEAHHVEFDASGQGAQGSMETKFAGVLVSRSFGDFLQSSFWLIDSP